MKKKPAGKEFTFSFRRSFVPSALRTIVTFFLL